ncbi:MAG: glycosyltransferase, partial [Clostridia bacterium]|nr:glycosyltransferase [Clostridia bacterium]
MKFSVIIPVYNKADTISASIDSVISQTEKDFELIIVDDGSSDNIDEVLSKYKNIHVITQENGGVSVARNSGIMAAQGDYICFLDADDLWTE